MGGGRLEGVVPRCLAVIVRMDVDEARRDQSAVRIDHLSRRAGKVADLDDAPVQHGDVGGVGRRSGAVDDGPSLDHGVEHGLPPGDCA